MVNIPHRSSESLMAATIAERAASLRRSAGALVLAVAAALILGTLLRNAKIDTREFVPLDEPQVTWLFTA